MDLNKTLYIYTRVSTTSQEEDGTSLETQRELGIKKSQDLGFEYQLFNEGGQSSSHDDFNNRPVLTELLSKIDEGHIKHLFVYNTDRLSRNKVTWNVIRFKLFKSNVTLYTSTGIYNSSSPTDDLLLGILSEISSYDNLLRTERTRLGKLNRVKQGYWMGGPPPFGYKLVNKKLESDEYESKWVNYIFEQFVKKITIREIKMGLLGNGVQTRRKNNVWSLGSIEKLLTNTHYIGFYYITDKKTNETVRCECEPIISVDLFNQTTELKQSRSLRRVKEGNQKKFYLLRDFLVCGVCGTRMSAKTQTDTTRSVYYCPRKERNYVNEHSEYYKKCTNNRYLKINLTDDLVWNTVVDVLSNSKQFREEIKGSVLGEQPSYRLQKIDIEKFKKSLKTLSNEIRDSEKLKKNVIFQYDVLQVQKLSDETQEISHKKILVNIEDRIRELEFKKYELNKRIHDLENKMDWVDWVSEFKKNLKKLSDSTEEEKHKLLIKIVESITVNTVDKQTHQLVIEFKLPYIDDELVWNNPTNKKLGYTITNGKKTKELELFDEKKYQKNQ
jgi:DNA invertase Pin-like site-specific DNA recombinase